MITDCGKLRDNWGGVLDLFNIQNTHICQVSCVDQVSVASIRYYSYTANTGTLL
jgi:hypothetical protein